MIYIRIFVALFFVSAGTYVVLKSEHVAILIKKFYRNYPILRYASDRQLTARVFVVRILGFTFILVGLWILFVAVKNPESWGSLTLDGRDWQTVE